MIRDEKRSTVHMFESDREYLQQTLFTMTILHKTWKWILSFMPLRVWVVALMFLCICVASITRHNVILAVVSMTVDLHDSGDNADITPNYICPPPEKFDPWIDIDLPQHPDINITGLNLGDLEYSIIAIDNDDDGIIRLREKVYAWSSTTQSNIFSAFFWSHFLCMVPAGLMSKKLGGRLIISTCLLGSALISLNTPLVTDHVTAFIVMRFMLGILHVGLFPAAFAIICNWIPVEERSVCFALLEVAERFAAILIFMISGWINDVWGWPALYFLPGIWSFMAFFVAVTFVRDRPAEAEKLLELETKETEPHAKRNAPMTDIILNLPVLSCGFFKFASRFNMAMIGSKIPTYLKIILHQDLSENGYTNAVIYAVMAVSLTVAGALSDQIINRKILTRTQCRKVFAMVTGIGCALTFILIPAAGCCPYKVHVILFLNAFFFGFVAGSDNPLPAEMTQNFPAEVFSILKMMGMASGLVAAAFAGFVLDNMADKWAAWCLVYWASAALLIVATIFFVLFASAERQPFDFVDEPEVKKEKQDA